MAGRAGLAGAGWVLAALAAEPELVELLDPQAASPPARQSAKTDTRITALTISVKDYAGLTLPAAVIGSSSVELGGRGALALALEGGDSQGCRAQRRPGDQQCCGQWELAIASGQDPGHRVGQITGDADLQPLSLRSVARASHAVSQSHVAGAEQPGQIRRLGIALHVQAEQPTGDPGSQEGADTDRRS